MGGSSTTAAASIPPPVDYTAAMGMASSNSMITALGAQGVQTFGIMEASMNRSEITAAHLELGLERLAEKGDEAKLLFRADRLHEQNRHDEKMETIDSNHEEKMAELDQPQTVDTTSFTNS